MLGAVSSNENMLLSTVNSVQDFSRSLVQGLDQVPASRLYVTRL